VIDGILEWNKAFERIGFKDAVQAKVQPDDATFDTAASATPRCAGTSLRRRPAIGPSHVDPRTGEILDADILMTDVFTRGSRRFIVEDLPRAGTGHEARAALPGIARARASSTAPSPSSRAASEFALDILEARGELEPDSPEAEAFVHAYVKEVISHEVGHTLGLRHNFRSSTIYSAEQLADPEFTRRTASSARDGLRAFNIPLKGREEGRLRASRPRPLRLLGDRVRLQAARRHEGQGRAREGRRARREGAVARLRHGRGLVHRRLAAGHGPRR
jgi:hypothetical protein